MKQYRNHDGKLVGQLENGNYVSIRKKSAHLLRVMDAWGIDTKILHDLEKEGCKNIGIHDSENKEMYTVPLSTLIEKGIERDFGHEEQTFLPRSYWTKI